MRGLLILAVLGLVLEVEANGEQQPFSGGPVKPTTKKRGMS